jgi:hypothetical protein
MTRFLKVAYGVPILIVAYAANATGGFQFSLSNQLPNFCKIGGDPAYNLDTAATITNPTTSSARIDFGANFANPDATGRQMSGNVRFPVYATVQCNYVLTSAYGALKNVSAGEMGIFRDYYADAYDVSASGTLVHLDSLSPDKFINQFTIPAPAPDGWRRNTIAIEFSIPKTSSPLAAGEYEDVLSLTITPSI